MTKKVFILFSLVSILILLCYTLLFSNYVFPWQKKNAIETTLVWSGIVSLPVNYDEVTVTQEGSVFTRQFVLEFETSKENIEKWVKTDKGFKNVSFTTKYNRTIYDFHPGKESSYGGTVTIQNNKVLINMSWS